MANISYQNKVFHALGLLCFLLLIQMNNAFQYQVGGGSKGWTVPDNTSSSSKSYLNDWAKRTRFQIGDSLLFAYDPSQDSVLQVSEGDYENCTTKNPIATFSGPKTVFTFNHSGPHYFISGNKDNCLKNEKLVVVVLADRSSNHSANTNQTTAAPSPSLGYSDMVPAPTPSSVETPPAPAGIADINPTPAPAGVSPNSASSLFVSFVGSMGAFFASSLILSF
ncbi:early nodulin-like protein 3 [Populus alba x Populus x berolinensis]|nr:early nodulin-like protein 3 [Populus alba x Populus x berolinensis]